MQEVLCMSHRYITIGCDVMYSVLRLLWEWLQCSYYIDFINLCMSYMRMLDTYTCANISSNITPSEKSSNEVHCFDNPSKVFACNKVSLV